MMGKEFIEYLAENYELSESTIYSYASKLLKRKEIKNDDANRFEYCLECLVSERSSIAFDVNSEDRAYSLEQSIERAIQQAYGYGDIDPRNDISFDEMVQNICIATNQRVVQKI